MFSLLKSARLATLANVRNYIVPTRTLNVIPVYEQTPRLIPKGENALKLQEKKMFAKYDKDGSKRALFDRKNPGCPRAGDVVRIVKTDKSSFVGMVLGINRNSLGTTLLLRTKIGGIGVENRFQVYNPDIEKIDLLKVPAMRWPKEKHYFVRGTKKYDAGDLDSFVRRQRRTQK